MSKASDNMAQPPGSWRTMLAARPMRNRAAGVVAGATGEVSISVATKRQRFLVPPLSWLVPLKPARTVRLDRLGTEVWALCDGERTVEAVIDEFASRHGLSFHEARVAVTGYLTQLVQRGALAIAMQRAEE